MKRFELFTVAGLLLTGMFMYQPAFSQENFNEGYIVKQNGDTVLGFIDYRNWDKNPEKIRFKSNVDENAIFYNPTEIIEFGVKDEIYVGAIVNAEVSSLRSDKLGDNPELNIRVDTVFLQTIFRGHRSLFYYKNAEGRDNFYIMEGTEFELLIYKKYDVERDGREGIAENKKYLNQLALYLNDCVSIQTKVNKTGYKSTDLVKLFQYYYSCSASDDFFHKKLDKAYIETGLLAGVSLTSLNFSSSGFPYLAEAEFDQSINFTTGLYLDIILPKNQGKWSVNNEIFYTSYNVTGTYVESKSDNFYETSISEIGYSYLKINNMLRFKYPLGNMFLFANAGIANGFAIAETNYKESTLTVSSTETVTEGVAMDETSKYEQSFLLGTGARYNKFSFEFRYENGNGMSAYKNLNSSARRFYFLFGFRF